MIFGNPLKADEEVQRVEPQEPTGELSIDTLEARRDEITARLEEIMAELSAETGIRWLKHKRYKTGDPNRRRERFLTAKTGN